MALRVPSRRTILWFGTVLLAVAGWAGYRLAAKIVPFFRSTDRFVAYAGESRVRYEPGAETMAAVVAEALPAAMATVERAQYRPFTKPVTVYVCATVESLKSYGASESAAGFVRNHQLFISPKPQNTVERLPRVLTHELSHLHLDQELGPLQLATPLPAWFVEGLAAYVSGGGGAEMVTEDEARAAIALGHRIHPGDAGGLFRRTDYHGLTVHMFYRQGAMFFAFLKRKDESKLRTLLLGLEDGQRLAPAVDAAYGMTSERLWEEFVADATRHSREQVAR